VKSPVKRGNKNSPVSLAKSFGSFAEKEQNIIKINKNALNIYQ